jgi:hypothetical protein
LLLPHVVWRVAHGFQTREFISNAQAHKMAAFAPGAFLALLQSFGTIVRDSRRPTKASTTWASN